MIRNSHHHSVADCYSALSSDSALVEERISIIEQIGLPVYRTTWFLDDVDILNTQMHNYYQEEGLTSFKLKINNSSKWAAPRLAAVRSGIPSKFHYFCRHESIPFFSRRIRVVPSSF